jgi:hypothetical protein
MQALPESVQAMVASVYEMLMKGGGEKRRFRICHKMPQTFRMRHL